MARRKHTPERIVADNELEIDTLQEIAKGNCEPVPAPPGV